MKTKLTAKNVRTLATPKSGQVEYSDKDLPGFALRVTSNGVRSFVLHYRPKEGQHKGKLTRWTIGRLTDEYGLADARAAARDARVNISDHGADPAHYVAEVFANQPALANNRYETVVKAYIAKYQIAKKQNASAPEVRRVLLKEGAHWKNRPVSELTRRDVHALLDGLIEQDKPYLANRTFAYLRTFFKWCVSRDYIEHSPCEGVERPFDNEKSRERHYTDDEIKALWAAADELGGFRGAYLKIILLTGKRRGEVAGLNWSELDLEGENSEDGQAAWNLPEGRSKNSRAHNMPLSGLAVRVLTGLPHIKDNPNVFAGRVQGKPINGWTIFQRDVQKESGVSDFFFHGCRHTLKTRLGKIGIAPHIKDKMLHHAPPRSAGEGYDHYSYIREQREGFERWADHIASIVWPENVEGLHG